MTSPFTGGKATLKSEESTLAYRNEKYSYIRYFYVCEDTGIQFTDAETDGMGLKQIHDQYRRRHGIPSAEEMKETRLKYGLSASCMSRILGLGENQYRLYENGEMPSEQIGRMLSIISDRNIMMAYVRTSINTFPSEEYEKLISKLSYVSEPAQYHIRLGNAYSVARSEAYSFRKSSVRCKRARWTQNAYSKNANYGRAL